MSTRKEKFMSFCDNPYQRKLLNKLSWTERNMCIAFICENDKLNKDEFAEKANRWLLDKPKPKNYTTMWALVTQCNTE